MARGPRVQVRGMMMPFARIKNVTLLAVAAAEGQSLAHMRSVITRTKYLTAASRAGVASCLLWTRGGASGTFPVRNLCGYGDGVSEAPAFQRDRDSLCWCMYELLRMCVCAVGARFWASVKAESQTEFKPGDWTILGRLLRTAR